MTATKTGWMGAASHRPRSQAPNGAAYIAPRAGLHRRLGLRSIGGGHPTIQGEINNQAVTNGMRVDSSLPHAPGPSSRSGLHRGLGLRSIGGGHPTIQGEINNQAVTNGMRVDSSLPHAPGPSS